MEAPGHPVHAGVVTTTILEASDLVHSRRATVHPSFGVADVAVWVQGGGRFLGCRVETPRHIADIGVPAATSVRALVVRDARVTAVDSLLGKNAATRLLGTTFSYTTQHHSCVHCDQGRLS